MLLLSQMNPHVNTLLQGGAGELLKVLKLSLIEYELLKNEKATTKRGQNSRKHYSLTLVGKRKQRRNGTMLELCRALRRKLSHKRQSRHPMTGGHTIQSLLNTQTIKIISPNEKKGCLQSNVRIISGNLRLNAGTIYHNFWLFFLFHLLLTKHEECSNKQ